MKYVTCNMDQSFLNHAVDSYFQIHISFGVKYVWSNTNTNTNFIWLNKIIFTMFHIQIHIQIWRIKYEYK